ncbi:hypothetical protein P8452_48601 [Trifolium repens]|nr:hypothetical protein P8452_48601 [Trifolium repens]
MIPNAWFYKLKDMSKSSRKRNGSQSHHVMKNKVMTSPTTSQRSQYSSCRVSSSTNDIIIDMNNESFQGNSKNLDGFDAFSQHGLAPILTKQVKFDDKKIESRSIKLRVNSPKLVNKKIQAYGRKSVSSSLSSGSKVSRNDGGFVDGFAVVKSSIDPISDFKESMVEMIVENNIRGSKDLENLLACYLSLNSSEYHDVIVKAFEQIWYDMAQLRM